LPAFFVLGTFKMESFFLNAQAGLLNSSPPVLCLPSSQDYRPEGLEWRAVLGIELALCLLGRRSTTWASLPALFVLVIFEIGSHFIPRLAWTVILLFVLPH
jgi:hypothetical protein